MSLRQCDKCSEMVDEAKAFCPSCGHAFVEEEKRKEPSVFDNMEGTMQLGNTMYNQMLSDMGLNISDAPDKPAEFPLPVVQPVIRPAVQQVLQPAVQPVVQPALEPVKSAASSKRKWIIIGGVAVLLLLILLIVVALAAFVLWSRFG